jgi:MFS family permease
LAWALSVALLGAWPTIEGAYVLLTAVGTARTVLDVSSRTLMLRAAPSAVRGRIFGVLEGSMTIGLAIGSMLVPLLLSLGGAQIVLLAAAAVLAVAALSAAPALRGLERAKAAPSKRQGQPAQGGGPANFVPAPASLLCTCSPTIMSERERSCMITQDAA